MEVFVELNGMVCFSRDVFFPHLGSFLFGTKHRPKILALFSGRRDGKQLYSYFQFPELDFPPQLLPKFKNLGMIKWGR